MTSHLPLSIRIAFGYALIATLWVLYSDLLIISTVSDTFALHQLSSVKGVLFIIITAALLYVVLQQELWRRELAEQKLRDSASSFRGLFLANPLPMWVYDRTTLQLLEINDAAVAHYGYPRDAFLAMTVRDVCLAHDGPPHEPTGSDELARELRGQQERHRRHDGQPIDVIVRSYRLEFAGHDAVLAAIEDVTEHLRTAAAERALAEERDRLLERQQLILERTPIGCMIGDADLRITYWNPACERIFGFAAEEVIGRPPHETIVPSGAEWFIDELARLTANDVTSHGGGENLTRDGRVISCEWHMTPLRNERAELVGVLSMVQDVTERRRVEAAEARARRALRTLSEVSQALVRADTVDTLLQTICRSLVERGGYRLAWVGQAERDSARSIRPVACYGERVDYLEHIQLSWAEGEAGNGPMGTAIRLGKPVVVSDIATDPSFAPWRSAAIERGFAAVISLPLSDGAETFGALGIYGDEPASFDAEEVQLLTELAGETVFGLQALRTRAAREAAERTLHATSTLMQAIIEASPVAIVAMDREGVVELWNPAAERIFGWSADEAVGQLLPIVLSEQTAEFMALLAEVVAGERLVGREVTRRHRDGTPIDLLLSAAPLADAAGTTRGVVAVVADHTEHKRALEQVRTGRLRLQALSQRLLDAQEAERRRIATELHDEIGQALTAIKIGVQGAAHAPDLQQARGTLAETLRVVDQVLGQVRALSLDLRPSILDDLGLLAALRWYIDRQAQWGGLHATLSVTGLVSAAGERLSATLETVCFRIVQEALTNVVRHAHARSVAVELDVGDAAVQLAIVDDGVGFDVGLAQARALQGSSLGLLGMQERVTLIGGALTLDSRPGRGTAIRATLPRLAPSPALHPSESAT